MKQRNDVRVMPLWAIIAVWVCFCVTVGGCISVPQSPGVHYFTLAPIEQARVSGEAPQGESEGTTDEFNLPSGISITFGPVTIPDYLNRPHIVTKNKDATLTFSQFNRWGQSLERALTYAISEDLASIFPGVTIYPYPWNSPVPARYQIITDVVRLESELDGDMVFIAHWTVLDAQNKAVLLKKRSQFSRPISPHTYGGLVETLNTICVSLSKEIAQGLVFLGRENLLSGEKDERTMGTTQTHSLQPSDNRL